ncbi:MAG: class II aldolase/adducin family protein [Sulfurimonas sp.]|nr:class II aldolase/adducin family protein [Sulfurimonas sp.]
MSFPDATTVNGGSIEELKTISKTIPQYDLVLWMPDINNDIKQIKIVKKIGAVLIVSKVLSDCRTKIDAVTRIFKYGGNAVIAIEKESDKFKFQFIDALNNSWYTGDSIHNLSISIENLYAWTKGANRKGTLSMVNPIEHLIRINKMVQLKSAEQNIRYFGNLSTRCTKMFPSIRTINFSVLVSARNTDKNSLTPADMVQITTINGVLRYFGEKKPSVDSPIQMALYEALPAINFFIHGHALIDDAPTTKHYYPCGDLREVDEIVELVTHDFGVINLKNHGFLMFARTLDELESIATSMQFTSGS